MAFYTPPVQNLIDQFSRLPGIGPKSAQRIAFHLLQTSSENASSLAAAIEIAKREVRFCEICCNFSATEICELCQDPRRDTSVICVVEESRDISIVERCGEFSGLYHVLHGVMNPIEGIGPNQLRVAELLNRLKAPTPEVSPPSPNQPPQTQPPQTQPPNSPPSPSQVKEIIVATSPNLEGEATAMYLARLLTPLGVIITRPASGLPVGGDLEYIDELTLGRALSARQQITP